MCDQIVTHKLPVVVVLFLLNGFVYTEPQLNIPQFPDQARPPDDFGTNDINRQQDNRFRGDIRSLLQQLDLQASQQCTNNVAAQWNFETNINQLTQLDAVRFWVNLDFDFLGQRECTSYLDGKYCITTMKIDVIA